MGIKSLCQKYTLIVTLIAIFLIGKTGNQLLTALNTTLL